MNMGDSDACREGRLLLSGQALSVIVQIYNEQTFIATALERIERWTRAVEVDPANRIGWHFEQSQTGQLGQQEKPVVNIPAINVKVHGIQCLDND